MQVRLQVSAMLTKILMLAILSAGVISCQKELKFDPVEEPDHNLVLRFKPVVQFDSVEMKFDTVTYKNFFKEDFTVKAFKFYIHGIELINTDSNKTYPVGNDKYFLVDFADSNSIKLKLTVMPYKYNRIAFILGVDSALNVSGAQTDALDPAKGMFWSWNTGYIMAKLEGVSPVSTAPAKMFEYHIGGFKQAESVIKRVTLLFPFGENVDMKPGKTTEINVTADAYDWFNSPHDIRISANAAVMTPGALAQQIAENYSKMFTVIEIVND
jgi:hypothetical protein